MAEDPGTNGGGGGTIQLGGTASSMCAISPSDLVGTIGNLLSRIEDLEKIVSNVLGANLHASTLGDISSQVGWVYGVEYMGVPGWIQTSYGTLIPPPGFTLLGSGITLSDGNTYSAVHYDENGVLQFGFKTDGTINGALGSGLTNTANADYYLIASIGHLSGSKGITLTASTVTTIYRSYTLEVAQAGLYQLSASCVFECNIGIGDTGTMDGKIQVDVNGATFDDFVMTQAGNEFYNQLVNAGASFSGIYKLAGGDAVSVQMSMTVRNGTLANRAVDNVRIGLIRISGTT